MMESNVSLKPGYTQVCVWPGTFIPEGQTSAEFEAFMKKEFDVEAQYLETIVTKPDLDCHGKTVVADTGGRKDLFFALKDGWPSAFAVKRIQYGIRWVEDALARGNYSSPIYPERVFGYKSWNADGYGDEVEAPKEEE